MGVNVVAAAAAVVCRSEVCPLPSEDWSEFIGIKNLEHSTAVGPIGSFINLFSN